jgi:hypothetical protein
MPGPQQRRHLRATLYISYGTENREGDIQGGAQTTPPPAARRAGGGDAAGAGERDVVAAQRRRQPVLTRPLPDLPGGNTPFNMVKRELVTFCDSK